MNEKLLRVALEVSTLPKKKPQIQETHLLTYPEGPEGPEVELTVQGYVDTSPAAPFNGLDHELVVTGIRQSDGTPWTGELAPEQEQKVLQDMLDASMDSEQSED